MGSLGFPEHAGLKQFEADRVAAESTRQNAIATAVAAGGGGVGAAVKAADTAYHRRISASAQINGIRTDGPANALRDLGTGGT